jgi:cell cycle sensor histidine kinase DivJ
LRSFPSEFAAWVNDLTHQTALGCPLTRARHKSFVLARLTIAASVLISAPSWLFFYGWPTAAQLLVFLLAQAPLISIAVLSRIGNLRYAQAISIAGWLGLAVAVDGISADMQPVYVLLLTVALIEATLTFEPLIVSIVFGLAMGLIVIDTGIRSFGALDANVAASITNVAVTIAPLIVYVAILLMGDIRAEHERMRADRRNARDLRLLTGALGDIVIHLDRSGSVVSILGDTHKAYGLSERDLLGRGFFQRVHIGDRPAYLKLVADTIDDGGPTHAIIRLRVNANASPSGEFVEPAFNFFDARTCPVDAEGENESAAPVVCILRDITQARRAEEEIAAARRESEKAAAAKSRFLANVSHELRTPLNAIIGFSEMLGNESLAPADPDKRREYAKIVHDSGQHLLEVVNSILDMSKIESGLMELVPEPFSLPTLLDQCCDMMQLKADEAGVSVTRHYTQALEEIVADRRACKQIFINLLSNAVKFTPRSGRVKVTLNPDGKSFVARIVDSGIGISSDDLARLGDPFFQVSSSLARSHQGTGLGLSVVRGLVGLHGGSIVVESSPRVGTCVTVRLPLDCRNRREKASWATKIETIARHGVIAPGQDIDLEDEVVKKIA